MIFCFYDRTIKMQIYTFVFWALPIATLCLTGTVRQTPSAGPLFALPTTGVTRAAQQFAREASHSHLHTIFSTAPISVVSSLQLGMELSGETQTQPRLATWFHLSIVGVDDHRVQPWKSFELVGHLPGQNLIHGQGQARRRRGYTGGAARRFRWFELPRKSPFDLSYLSYSFHSKLR